jgi:hypothetical protein
MRTLPLNNSVAVWPERGVTMEPVGVKVPARLGLAWVAGYSQKEDQKLGINHFAVRFHR